MEWKIITDSSCDYELDVTLPDNIIIGEVPFVISVGDKEYIDDSSLDVAVMVDDMENSPEASRTSCPAPDTWYNQFKDAAHVIAITISSKLSGSYNSAMAAKEMILEKNPMQNIFVLDSKSAGSALSMFVEETIEYIGNNDSFSTVVSKLKESVNLKHTVFALASYNNLIKNGRVSKLTGIIAGKLGIWGIGVGKDGEIDVKKKVRGDKRVVNAFIDDMKENGFNGGSVIISHCQNLDLANQLKDQIIDLWKSTKVKILPTGGLCSYYAERRGLIVAY